MVTIQPGTAGAEVKFSRAYKYFRPFFDEWFLAMPQDRYSTRLREACRAGNPDVLLFEALEVTPVRRHH